MGHNGLHNTKWNDRLRFLLKHPMTREESCFSKGKPGGDIILVLNAQVREAYNRDVVSVVNPYTGEKVIQNDFFEEGEWPDTDPESHFQNSQDFERTTHSKSDELFCRFDIQTDLKAIEVWVGKDEDEEVKLNEVRLELERLNLNKTELIIKRYGE